VIRIYFTSHKPDQGKKLSIKSRLLLIAIMFIVINVIFYFAFDSSDESEKSLEFDDTIPINIEENQNLENEIINPIKP